MISSEWIQHIILRSLCISKKRKINEKIIGEISEDNFTAPSYKKSIRRVISYYQKKGRFLTWKELINDPTISEEIRKKIKAKEIKRKKVKNNDSSLNLPKNYDEYKNLVQYLYSDSKYKSMIDLQNELTNSLSKNEAPTSDTVDDILNRVSEQVDYIKKLENSSGTIVKLESSVISEKILSFRRKIKDKFFFPTGIKGFDSKNMGIPSDSFFLIAAKSGAGKSSLALQLGMNMKAKGGRVCYVPAEMNEEELLLRMSSNLLNVRMNNLVSNIDDYYKKMSKSLKRYLKDTENDGSCFDLYPPDPNETLEDVLSSTRTEKYNIVFVDYINLLSPMGGEDGWKALDMAGRYSKVYSTMTGTIVCLLAQLDDNTNDIRYAKALREHAHNAWFWRESKDDIRDKGYIKIRQEKARNQDPTPFNLEADLSVCRFSDYSDDDFEKSKTSSGEKSKKEKPKAKKTDKNFDDLPSSNDV